MEQNRGLGAAIGIVCLIIGILIGLAIPRGRVATYVGRDFKAGQPALAQFGFYGNSYNSNLGANVYNGFNPVTRTSYSSYSSQYQYTQPQPAARQKIYFSESDCTDDSVINRYEQQFNDTQWQDFSNYCESIGEPLG